jgi:hypothetical protein
MKGPSLWRGRLTTDYVESFRITGSWPGLCGIPRGIAPPQRALPSTPATRACQPGASPSTDLPCACNPRTLICTPGSDASVAASPKRSETRSERAAMYAALAIVADARAGVATTTIGFSPTSRRQLERRTNELPGDRPALQRLAFSVIKAVDSLSLVPRIMLRTMSPMSTTKKGVIEPVPGDLKLSIPKMKMIPEICPMSKSRPFDVPSGVG